MIDIFIMKLLIVAGSTIIIMTCGVGFYRYGTEGNRIMLILSTVLLPFGIAMMGAAFSR